MSISTSMRIGFEQVRDWQRRGVTMADAAISLGRRPPDDWQVMIAIVAAEHMKATRILVARKDHRRSA